MRNIIRVLYQSEFCLQIRVSGYVVTGYVISDSKPVEGVSVILYGKTGCKPVKGCATSTENLSTKKDSDEVFLCLATTDTTGKFQFRNLAPGSYSVVPVYRFVNKA